jgi:two-component sensor histidine kinase
MENSKATRITPAANGPLADHAPTWNEADRLAALHDYGILDTGREAVFDDFVLLAANICAAPIAVINLIDQDRQWFKAEIGLDVDETPLDLSICAHAILQPGLFVVPDTTQDPRFSQNPLVTGEPRLRFYAGALLRTEAGLPLGTLCVLDQAPRPGGLTTEQQRLLDALARQVMTQLELRRSLKIHQQTLTDLAVAHARTTDILESIPDPFYVLDREWRVTFANQQTLALWHQPAAAVIGHKFWDLFSTVPDLPKTAGAVLHLQVMRDRQPGRTEFISALLKTWCEMTVYPTSDGGISVYFQNIDSRKRSEAALTAALAEKDLLMQEVHHRVKNSLQIVQNLLSLQARASGDPNLTLLLDESSARVHTIGSMHDRLYRDGSVSDVAIEPYLRSLIDDMASALASNVDNRTISLHCDPGIWPADDVPTLGLVLTELVTNALKYGTGKVSVSLHQTKNAPAILTVSDEGQNLPADFDPAKNKGLGMRLIIRLLRGRGGRFEVLRDGGHTCFQATLPLSDKPPKP